ncbi:hypothetical protein DBR17_04445 [Sphingomonas sp. HMWF008]|nr:hypothetical protein DBR17_04445 [Sphingomonas sp. HMWF008]
MFEARPDGARPHKSATAAALLLLIGIMLGGCQKHAPPPPLTDLDLARGYMGSFGIKMPDAALRDIMNGDAINCVDFHRPERTLAEHASRISTIDLLAMRMHFRDGYSNWHPPKEDDDEVSRVDWMLEHRLGRASARAIVRINAEAASEPPYKPWPKSCRTTFWFAKPVYVDDVAFVDTGSTCGGLCGSGSLYAFAYRNKRWTLVATTPTWIA